MYVERLRSGVEEHHVLLHLADTTYRRLKHLLYVDALLRMDHLIVAFF